MRTESQTKAHFARTWPSRAALLVGLLAPAAALGAGCAGGDEGGGDGGSAGTGVSGSGGEGATGTGGGDTGGGDTGGGDTGGGDTGGGGTGGGDAGGTGGSSTGGFGGGTGGEAGGPSEPALVSNTPSAEFTQTAEGDAAQLVLVGSTMREEDSGGQYYQEWFGEVYNSGSLTVCHVQVDISFKSGGTELVAHYGFADAPPHDSSSMVISCIPPGGSGFVYSNGFGTSSVSPSSVTNVDVEIAGNAYPGAVPSATEPEMQAVDVVEVYGAGSGYWALEGTARGRGGPVNNISLTAYPRDASGLVFERLSATNLESLPVGGTWEFETTSAKQSFTDYAYFFEYMNGTSSYSSGLQSLTAQRREVWRERIAGNRVLHQMRKH